MGRWPVMLALRPHCCRAWRPALAQIRRPNNYDANLAIMLGERLGRANRRIFPWLGGRW